MQLLVKKFFTTNHTNHHELAVRKTIFTFKFHKIKKEYEGFTENIGVKVRGVRVVSGK
jgi:hypothetical protein